ncbi:hypothetical protein [Pseudomonas asiatica]|uniref:hypothetical protein n=1 Tax=Pseudomonas asiatica TaxID=2219225 RepID=UPI0025AA59E4|nr:hypothetical protein [Pseudomonas asiatica]MDM9590483.1 hypothetical protein [Pseudomonas asiatica]
MQRRDIHKDTHKTTYLGLKKALTLAALTQFHFGTTVRVVAEQLIGLRGWEQPDFRAREDRLSSAVLHRKKCFAKEILKKTSRIW